MKEEQEAKKKQDEEEKKKKMLATSKAVPNSSRELRSLLSDVKTNKKWVCIHSCVLSSVLLHFTHAAVC